MIPYYAATVLALVLCLASRRFSENRGWKSFFAVLLVAVPFVVLAAFRDAGVGTDTEVYGEWMFTSATTYSLEGYLSYHVSGHGYLITLLTWGLCRFTGSLAAQYAVWQLLVFVPYYIVAKAELKDWAWVAVLFYGLYMFSVSLNIMIQCMAVSFGMLAWMHCKNGETARGIVWYAVSLLLHITSVVFAPGILIALIDRNASPKSVLYRYKLPICIISVVIACGGVLLINVALPYLALLKDSYSSQVNNAGNMERLPYAWVLWVGSIAILSILFRSRGLKETDGTKDFGYYDLFFIISIVLYSSIMISSQLNRLSLYYFAFLPFFLVDTAKRCGDLATRVTYLALCLAATALCGSYILMSGAQGTYPYTSVVLGIG